MGLETEQGQGQSGLRDRAEPGTERGQGQSGAGDETWPGTE